MRRVGTDAPLRWAGALSSSPGLGTGWKQKRKPVSPVFRGPQDVPPRA